MVNLTFVLVPSRVNADGSHTIRLKITSGNSTAYISTPYRVQSASQFSHGSVIRHDRAADINQRLAELMSGYRKAIPDTVYSKITASEVKALLQKTRITNRIIDFAEQYIARLVQNKQMSYANNMKYTRDSLEECFGPAMTLEEFSPHAVLMYEDFLFRQGGHKRKDNSKTSSSCSPTTVNIRMSHLKALLNYAITQGMVSYDVHPFARYRMPAKNVRDICISKSELARLRDMEFTGTAGRRYEVARDMFMLSFYCAGINLTDLLDAKLSGSVLTFIRKKTANKKQGANKEVSITIQPEAQAIIDKYIGVDGKLNLGYNYAKYENLRTFITKSLGRIGKDLGFEKPLSFYAARKTFVQFGSGLGIPLYVLEYSIGQTIKDANNRPIFNYLKVMRNQSDYAIRAIIDYSLDSTPDDDYIPTWARRG